MSGPARPSIVDLAWRAAYRAAFLVLRVWWRVRRPRATGALVAIWRGPRVLLVRNSYRSALSIPGGGVGRGEDPRAAAARELREELGVTADPSSLAAFGRVDVEHGGLRDRCHVFEMTAHDPFRFAVDGRELVWAGFLDPRSIPAGRLHAPTRAYLRFRGVLQGREGHRIPPPEEPRRPPTPDLPPYRDDPVRPGPA